MTDPDLNTLPLPPALLDSLTDVEAVSLAVFGTLFVRPLQGPEDRFGMLGAMFGVPDFGSRRRQARQNALAGAARDGGRAITLADIYASLEDPPASADRLAAAEYDLEHALAHPDPLMAGLLRTLVARGTPVVLTAQSDLPSSFVRSILRHHDLPAVPVCLSSDLGAVERDRGSLFTSVAQRLGVPPERILHIGDDPVADVQQAEAAGFRAFLHVPRHRVHPSTRPSPSASLASGLARTLGDDVDAGAPFELGFRYGGPAAAAFLQWLEQRASADGVDALLFVTPETHLLRHLAEAGEPGRLPRLAELRGSRTAFLLSATSEASFDATREILLGEAAGRPLTDLFGDIGVTPPADWVLSDLRLPPGTAVSDANAPAVRDLLSACRADILNRCRRNRRGLFHHLQALGIGPGRHVGLVSLWDAGLADDFEAAVGEPLDFEVTSYAFVAAEAPDSAHQRSPHRQAMLGAATLPRRSVEALQARRALWEPFFSGSDGTIIGYDADATGRVAFVVGEWRDVAGEEPRGREAREALLAGAAAFAARYRDTCSAADFVPWPLDTVTPFLDFLAAARGEAVANDGPSTDSATPGPDPAPA